MVCLIMRFTDEKLKEMFMTLGAEMININYM